MIEIKTYIKGIKAYCFKPVHIIQLYNVDIEIFSNNDYDYNNSLIRYYLTSSKWYDDSWKLFNYTDLKELKSLNHRVIPITDIFSKNCLITAYFFTDGMYKESRYEKFNNAFNVLLYIPIIKSK